MTKYIVLLKELLYNVDRLEYLINLEKRMYMDIKKMATKLKIAFGIYLLIELVLLFFNIESNKIQGIIRFFLTLGLFYEIYQGKKWAQITWSVLSIIALVISIPQVFSLITIFLTIGINFESAFLFALLLLLLATIFWIIILIDGKKYQEYSQSKFKS